MGKEEGKAGEDSSKTKENFISRTSGKVSEFFLHLMEYGIFYYKDGEITMFNNPYTFIPISALATMQYELIKYFPNDANVLIEWLGRADGRTASLILVKRYGISNKNVDKLLEAGTLTGLGKLSLKKLEEEEIIVACSNSPFSIYFKDKYGKTNIPVDFYIMGALVGADIAITGREACAKETKCIAKGDSECEYKFNHMNYKRPLLIKKYLNKDPDDMISNLSDRFLKRMKFSSVSFRQKNIQFGDGNFIFNNIKGISIPVFVLVILNELLYKYKKEIADKIFDKIAEAYINELLDIKTINKEPNIYQIQEILNKLSMFGFGILKVKSIKNNKILIEDSTNNFAKEYIEIFKFQKEPKDYFICKLIEKILNKSLNRPVECIEKVCKSQKNNYCLFEVSIK